MCKCIEFDFIQAGLRKVTLDIHRAGKRSRMSACGFSLGVKCLQIQNHDIKHATDIKHKFNIFFGIPRLDSIESSGFFSLLPIIIGVFWGVWTRSKRLDAVAPRY